jgi:CheY-like chemotaxis protein
VRYGPLLGKVGSSTKLRPIVTEERLDNELGVSGVPASTKDVDVAPAPVSSVQPVGGEPVPHALARVALRSRSSVPPPMELAVLLVAKDRVRRSMLARDIVRARWSVDVVDGADEVVARAQAGAPLDVAIVDFDHPCAGAIVDALAACFRGAVVVALASSQAAACKLLEGKDLPRSLVRPRATDAKELMDAVRQLL